MHPYIECMGPPSVSKKKRKKREMARGYKKERTGKGELGIKKGDFREYRAFLPSLDPGPFEGFFHENRFLVDFFDYSSVRRAYRTFFFSFFEIAGLQIHLRSSQNPSRRCVNLSSSVHE